MWSVNTDEGHFQLGNLEPNDDLYIMNITLVNARFFDKLLKTTSPRVVDQTSWCVAFEAFGMFIESDVFTLDKKDESRITYLGDKSTARIRASTAAFRKFLSESIFTMQIQTIGERKRDTVGIGSVALAPLLHPEVHEIRQNITIIPQSFQVSIPDEFSPKLSLVVDVTASLNFYSTYVKLEEITFPQNITRSKESLTEQEDTNESSTLNNNSSPGKMTNLTQNDNNNNPNSPNNVSSKIANVPPPPTTPNTNTPNNKIINVPSPAAASVTDTNNEVIVSSVGFTNSNASAVYPEVRCEPGEFVLNLKFNSFNIKSKTAMTSNWAIAFNHPPLGVMIDNRCVLVAILDKTKVGKGTHYFYFEEDEDEDWTFSIPKFTREILDTPLEVFFHKESTARKNPIVHCNIPIGNIFTQEKTDNGWCLSGDAPLYTINPNGEMKVGYINYTFTLKELVTEIEKTQNHGSPVKFSNPFHAARDKVPSKEDESSRSKTVESELTRKNNDVTPRNSDKSKPNTSIHNPAKLVTVENERLSSKSFNDSATLHDWRVETERKFRQSLKEKEQSYFQVLAAEYKKQKEVSEKIVKEKLDEYEALKKEANRKLKALSDKEEALKKKEKEVEDLARAISLEQSGENEKLKLENRRLKEELKIEATSLGKQLEQALAENKAAVGKNRILQEKLALSEEKYAELSAMRHKWPEAETQRKLDSLEQRNLQLTKELEMSSSEQQRYKKEAQKLVQELSRKRDENQEQLRDENESLKLQLLASHQQELLNKDLEQVASVSNELRAVKDTFDRQRQLPLRQRSYNMSGGYTTATTYTGDHCLENERPGDLFKTSSFRSGPNLELENEKLMTTRETLLKSQAYTPQDKLIQNLEEQINKNFQKVREINQRRN